MSGLTGKGSLSIKKQEVAQSRLPAVSFRKVRALHKCALDETIINITSLISPGVSEAKNYSAPNPSLLASINMFELQDNVEITSTIRGRLMQNVSYVISGASTIELLFEAEENEILEIVIDHVARTGATLVDARPLVVTGTLAAGDTDFNVGEPFKVGEHPLAQHGSVMVMVDNQPMYRNTNNQAPGSGVTGDYYEVHAGGGLGTIIRFNVPDLVNDRTVSVISIGALVERPASSQMALIEAVQGQIDAMIPTLAALAGVDETDFQAQPNNVDLKSFGDRVLTLEQILDLPLPISEAVQTYVPTIGSTGTPPTKGTRSLDVARYWRNGEFLEWEYDYIQTAADGANGTGTYKIPIPSGLKIDTNHHQIQSVGSVNIFIGTPGLMGDATNFANQTWTTYLFVISDSEFGVMLRDTINTANVAWAAGVTNTTFSTDALRFTLKGRVKIVGWNATQTVREALGL